MMILQSMIGLFMLAAIACLFSEEKKNISYREILTGIMLQLAIAVILLKVSFFRQLFLHLNTLVATLQEATNAGTSFVFGYLGGAPLPFAEKTPGSSFVLALQALPLVLVVSALSSLLFYWKILPVMVRGFSWALQKSMRIGGAVGLGAAANIFVGMIEAPLFIRPYLKEMSRSELFTVMTCGMATIAGTVMVLYASILNAVIPGAMGHILVASIISAPAAITVSRIMIPATGAMTTGDIVPPQQATSSMDAVVRGTMDGIHLLINIIAMLVVLVALVFLVNKIIGIVPTGGEPLTLQKILGYFMAPVVWLMGIPWSEAQAAGSLMGIKTVLNEFLAYLELAAMPADVLSDRSRMIMTYALCGFANFGSLGIMLGGMGTVVPERRDDIVAMGMKSIVSGTLATCMTGAVIGIVYSL